MRLNRLYGEHSVLEMSEVMIYVFMSKNTINVLHFNGEFMASNPTIQVIVSQDDIGVEFPNQWFTNLKEISKKLFPTSIHKTAWDEIVLEINKIHKLFLNDWSFVKVLVIQLKMLGGEKQGIIHAFPLVNTLCNGFPWNHL